MTRINVIPVDELTDNFLLAEHFELPRVFLLVHNHMMKGRHIEDLKIPPTYRLGSGHVTFFYDKLAWLAARHRALREEGLKRNLKLSVDPSAACIKHISFRHTLYWGDYEPTQEAIQLNLDRLQYRRRYEGGSYPSK
jgi:deoxyribonuclease (pyrimidine dimer)